MIYKILAHTVESYPENLAVICGAKRFSYAQFKERVDRLSCALASLGISRHDRVAVLLKNCHRFLELYFSTAKIGAVLVPMNYRLAFSDFIYILNNAQAKTLIAQPDIIQSIFGNESKFPFLRNIILAEPGEYTWHNERCLGYEAILNTKFLDGKKGDLAKDCDVAQIYYTSGTTGKPKGVMLTHRNNMVHAEGTIEELGLSSEDRWLHVSPMFHLADAWAVWSITKVAATHVMVPIFKPELVLNAIEEHGVTVSNFIPTMLNILVNFADVKSYDVSTMRLVLSGGAPIATEIVRKITKVFGCDYIQTYGLTETSPFLTISVLKEEMRGLSFEEKLRYMVTTGRPFYNIQLKVVKDDGTEVIPNERDVGEIIVKGDTVTPGYWRSPEETSGRIIDGWLYTRDLAVVSTEGYLTVVDRKDDMIVTGGENVYSIEVEDVLYSHPSVLEAAVIGLPDPVWGEKVTAIVVLKKDQKLSEGDIIRHCREILAHFRVPKMVIFTGELPKTGSGKICKYKLRQEFSED